MLQHSPHAHRPCSHASLVGDRRRKRTSARLWQQFLLASVAAQRIDEQTESNAAARLLARFGAHIGFGAAALAALLGWLVRGPSSISTPIPALGYFLGLVAIACMTRCSSIRCANAFAFLKFLGPTKNWFRTHMVLGTLGPLAALYHCNFTTGSVNSRIALYAALARGRQRLRRPLHLFEDPCRALRTAHGS